MIIVGYAMEYSFDKNSVKEIMTGFANLRKQYKSDKLIIVMIGAGEKDDRNRAFFRQTVQRYGIADIRAVFHPIYTKVQRDLGLAGFSPYTLVFKGDMRKPLVKTDDAEKAQKKVEELLK